jgi:hypothetical protein
MQPARRCRALVAAPACLPLQAGSHACAAPTRAPRCPLPRSRRWEARAGASRRKPAAAAPPSCCAATRRSRWARRRGSAGMPPGGRPVEGSVAAGVGVVGVRTGAASCRPRPAALLCGGRPLRAWTGPICIDATRRLDQLRCCKGSTWRWSRAQHAQRGVLGFQAPQRGRVSRSHPHAPGRGQNRCWIPCPARAPPARQGPGQ